MDLSNNSMYSSVILSAIFTGIYYLVQSNEDKKNMIKTESDNYLIFFCFSFVVLYLLISNCTKGGLKIPTEKPTMNGGNCCPF